MLNVLVMLISSFAICSVLISLSTIISKKTNNWREKSSPFECGFNFFNSARIPFSMRFFLIAIIFIIFDVEIALIIPLIPTLHKSSITKWFISSTALIFVITLGTILEWKEGSFEWKN